MTEHQTETVTSRIPMPTHSNELRELNALFGRINDKAWINQFLLCAERTFSMADKGVVSWESFRMHSAWLEVPIDELRKTWEAYLLFLEKTGARVTKLPSIDSNLWQVLL